MRAKKTLVELEAGNVRRKFTFNHATRLLKLKNCGWKIPDDSKFEFVEDAIRIKQITK